MIIFLEDVRFHIPNHAGSEKGIYYYKIYTCPLIYRLLRKSDSCCRYQTLLPTYIRLQVDIANPITGVFPHGRCVD